VRYGGHGPTKDLFNTLLKSASKPYYEILRVWIRTGVLNDPYNEFMVEERTDLSKDNLNDDFNDVYWEKRYTLKTGSVPAFLDAYKEKVLLAGKYLNVLRECSKFSAIDNSEPEDNNLTSSHTENSR
jgi:gamma-tubulin complex component 2